MSAVRCWCGSLAPTTPFSPQYVRCMTCDTVICTEAPDASVRGVADDAADFYGAQYWGSHQSESFGFPELAERARRDLPERCIYWLRALLRYSRPQGKLLEIGASHGAFLRLAASCGYDVMGIEMSPSVIDFAKRTFDVPLRAGPFESVGLPDAEFDVVCSFDVLEHFAEPILAVRELRRILKPGGIAIIQTPELPDRPVEALVAEGNRFLEHLRAPEHVFLFSRASIRRLFAENGFPVIRFDVPIFDYDMFFVVGAGPIQEQTQADIDAFLLGSAERRILLGLMDATSKAVALQEAADARLVVIAELKAACDERLKLIEELDRALKAK